MVGEVNKEKRIRVGRLSLDKLSSQTKHGLQDRTLTEKIMNTPTKITISRIIVVVLTMIALFVLSFFPDLALPTLGNTGVNLIFLVVFVVFLFASITDFLDGYLARKNNQVTDIGKFLDPVADKLLINGLLIFLIAPHVFAPYNHEQFVTFNGWCVILLVLRDIIVDAMRFIAANRGKVVAANIFGKIKTVLEMVAISLVLLNGFPFSYIDGNWIAGLRITDFVVYITTIMSLISGVIYLVQNRDIFKKG